MHPFFQDFNFYGFVHRGGDEVETENTYEAFRYSSELGFIFMETDVQITKDGYVVIFHDADLRRMASGYGYRIDPFTKARRMHFGMDFSAKRGTPIYATGDGTVSRADSRAAGFGKHVRIDHGFGYVTIYAHMDRYLVVKGDKIKRGDLIGYVGSSGRSVAPHLHYEIVKDGVKINPINFYSGSLSPAEFEELVKVASQENQSLD